MHCPYCRNTDSKVLDSRTTDDGGSIRRRRQCPSCERRFTTIEQMQLVVVKRSGVVEPFTRDKVINGVRKACNGRPVTEDQLALARRRGAVLACVDLAVGPAHADLECPDQHTAGSALRVGDNRGTG